MEIDSKPESMDKLDRRIIQLKIEREALKKETDHASQDRLEKLELDLARLEEAARSADEAWQRANTEAHRAAGRLTEAQNEVGRLQQLLTDFGPVAEFASDLQPDQLVVLQEACASVGTLDLHQIDTSSQRVRGALHERRGSAEREADQRARQLTATFETYANRWPDPNRGTGIASAGEYLAILDTLETAGLAQVRDAFLNAVNRWSGDDVNAVRSAIQCFGKILPVDAAKHYQV